MATETEKPVTPAQALGAFKLDGYNPFMNDPCTAEGLLREAHGILKVLGSAFEDSHALSQRGIDTDLGTLNPSFIASAMGGISSLVALAMFLQEQPK